MKLVREHINEKFTKTSDPVRDMGIGVEGFRPMFRLKRQYPGMNLPIGTIFGIQKDWGTFACVYYDKDGKQHGSTEWYLNYFTPWVGEFFEKI